MTRGRVGITAVLVSALLAAAWWFVRAPAVLRPATAPKVDDASVDIDPPSLHARNEAAKAVATMPADPWTFAESLVASAAQKTAERDKEDCGMAEAPQFDKSDASDTEPVQTRGPSPRYLAAQARIDAALRTSGDPLDRVTADFVNAGNLRTEAGREEAVVQQALASSDPRVYALAYGLCREHMEPHIASCAGFSAARWAQLDPGNGIPWVDLLGDAQARGDAAGVNDALAHLAASTRFDMRFYGPADTVAKHLPDDPRELAAGSDLVTQAVNQAAALALPAFKPLMDVCSHQAGGDEQRASQCVAVSDAMYAHSDTLISYAMSGVLLARTTGDESRRELVKAERALFAAHWSPSTGASKCGIARDLVKEIRRKAEIGEVETYREESRRFLPP